MHGAMQVIGGRVEVQVRPERLYQLLSMLPMTGREGQELYQGRGLPQAPGVLWHWALPDTDSEAPKYVDAKISNVTRRCHNYRSALLPGSVIRPSSDHAVDVLRDPFHPSFLSTCPVIAQMIPQPTSGDKTYGAGGHGRRRRAIGCLLLFEGNLVS